MMHLKFISVHLLVTISILLSFISSSSGYLKMITLQVLLGIVCLAILFFLNKNCNSKKLSVYYFVLLIFAVYPILDGLLRFFLGVTVIDMFF